MKPTDVPPRPNLGAMPARDNGALSVRWLAELCDLPAQENVPCLASQMLAQPERRAAAIAHIGWWSRHPDSGSHFERAAGRFGTIPDEPLVAALAAQGYDGFLYLRDDAIIGHFFFQRHDQEMHAFSGWADERHRGGKLVGVAAMDFVAHASLTHGVTRARIGTGGYPITDHLLAPLRRVNERLGWRIREGGWVEFQDSSPAAAREPDNGT